MKLMASEYLDDGRWGIISEANEIIVPISDKFPLSKEMAQRIAEAFNAYEEPNEN